MGVMQFIRMGDYYAVKNAETKVLAQSEHQAGDVPEINTDLIYEKLMKEKKEESHEQPWFDEKLDEIADKAQSESNKSKSEGDEAAKMFEQFAE